VKRIEGHLRSRPSKFEGFFYWLDKKIAIRGKERLEWGWKPSTVRQHVESLAMERRMRDESEIRQRQHAARKDPPLNPYRKKWEDARRRELIREEEERARRKSDKLKYHHRERRERKAEEALARERGRSWHARSLEQEAEERKRQEAEKKRSAMRERLGIGLKRRGCSKCNLNVPHSECDG
jgi:hypothetical protein